MAQAQDYIEIPILDVARRCGLVLDSRTLERREVEASCPFCGDRGAGKYHLSLNTERDVYRCNLCGASGNSVSLYARLEGKTNQQTVEELTGGKNVYRFPVQPQPKSPPEQEPKPLAARHDVYYDLLSHLALSDKHRADLRERGLTDERIDQNRYRSLPEDEGARQFLAGMLSDFHDLDGIPGFYLRNGHWTIAGKPGLLLPVCDKDGYIQGMQLRLDDETNPARKYRWLSSRHLECGTRSRSWIHVTGNVDAKVAYLTEGGLKGDVASFLDGDALFVCFAGINALGDLSQVLAALNVDEVAVALDMDKLTNWRVRKALQSIDDIVSSLGGVKARPMNWNMTFKGVDDFYKARHAATQKGTNMVQFQTNAISDRLTALWKKEYPRQDRGFIYACEWEEKRVPLASLICDAPRDIKKAQHYLQLLQEDAATFPPLVCVNGMVIDGQHRFWAYTQAGYGAVTIYQNKPWTLSEAA